jgi:hypothetical protein
MWRASQFAMNVGREWRMLAEGGEGMHWLAIGVLVCMLLPIAYVMHLAVGSKFSPAGTHVAAISRNPELGGFNALTQRGEREHCSCAGR